MVSGLAKTNDRPSFLQQNPSRDVSPGMGILHSEAHSRNSNLCGLKLQKLMTGILSLNRQQVPEEGYHVFSNRGGIWRTPPFSNNMHAARKYNLQGVSAPFRPNSNLVGVPRASFCELVRGQRLNCDTLQNHDEAPRSCAV